jgi:hypothetical protein
MTPRTVNIARIAKTTTIFCVVLASLCAITGRGDAWSVLFGGAVSVANLHLIRLLVSRLMSPVASGSGIKSIVAMKFLILLTLLAIALKRFPIDLGSFLIGAGTLFVAIVLDAVLLGEPVPEEGVGND